MKVSENWLRTFIDTPLSINQIAEVLTNAGIEVDNLEHVEQQGILTLKIPANRGDCLCMEGIARELSVLTKLPFKAVSVKSSTSQSASSSAFSVELQAPDLCPRYLGRIIRKIKPNIESPTWIKERLELAGLRCHSAVVDILNYVMLEIGQPLHAFDLNYLRDSLQIRRAKANEEIQLLDGKTVTLEGDTLIIADKAKPQAIAGIMGGLDSSVTMETTDLFIESAYFDPVAIRLGAKLYGLRTDSSQRFERGVDYELQERALNRATELLLEIVGGEPAEIIHKSDLKTLPKPSIILLRSARIAALLGHCPPKKEVVDILTRSEMQLEIQKINGENKTATETKKISETKKEKETESESKSVSTSETTIYQVTPPPFRQDLTLEIDLIEEIARIYGFEKFPAEKMILPVEYPEIPEKQVSTNTLKKSLADRGYFEACNYSFIEAKSIELFFPGLEPYLLANPISIEMAAMRPSHWPGLLQGVVNNLHRQRSRVRLFELGTCFTQKTERSVLSGVCAGTVFPEQWGIIGSAAKAHDFYDLKNDLQAALFTHLQDAEHIQILPLESATDWRSSALNPAQAAKIVLKSKTLGVMGALHPRIIQALDIPKPIFVFEIELAVLHFKIPEFRDLSKFPAIRRDLALIVEQGIFAEDLKSAIVNCVGEWLREVVIFDVYQGPGIESGKKSIALGLILQHPSRTLIDEEVTQKVSEVVGMLANKFQAILRE